MKKGCQEEACIHPCDSLEPTLTSGLTFCRECQTVVPCVHPLCKLFSTDNHAVYCEACDKVMPLVPVPVVSTLSNFSPHVH